MAQPRLAIIMSTTRAARFADKPAKWIYDLAVARGDMDIEIVDLRDYPMPFFDEPASNAYVPSANEVAQRWQEKVAGFDGYIFVTAEYNHGISGVLKNALDYAYPEWARKPAPASDMAALEARALASSCGWSWLNCRWRQPATACTSKAAISSTRSRTAEILRAFPTSGRTPN